MKSNDGVKSAVEPGGSGGHRPTMHESTDDRHQQRAPKSSQHLRRLQQHRRREHGPDPPSLHSVAKAKLVPRFTRIQVLSIIKLATMDKLRESGAGGPDDPAARERLTTTDAGPGTGTSKGDGCSDEFHHQFYNTGRIGRRNALPDILGTHCTTTTADLSSQLGALSTSECTGKPSDGSSNSIATGNNGQPPPTTTAT